MDRRTFFLGATTAASSLLAQNRTLKLGIIGCGWYGGVNARAAWKADGVEIAALCDADTKHLDETAALCEKEQGGRRPQLLTKDYRELLNMPGLDGVIIATPPHWHALPFIAACEKKLPVYMEKPLAYDVREGRAMARAQAKAGNIVQVGFQRRQSAAYQAVRDYLASGAPGRVIQADVQIHYTAAPLDNAPQDPPATLDWELWLGPAPKMPYSPNVAHRSWRLEENIGNGHLVDWGIHLIDATRVMLGLGLPLSVTAAGGIYSYQGKITTPDTLTAHFEFKEAPVVWRHRLWGAAEMTPAYNNGIFLFCEKETVFVTDNRWEVMPKGRNPEKRVHEIKPAADLGAAHAAEWLEAIRASRQPSCTVEDAWRSTTAVHLGMIAYKSARAVRFDAASETIKDDAAAARLLKRPYRAPYRHPYA
jgi:predicted dehydrogenase